MLLCWVDEHLASGRWMMTAVSGGIFPGKEQRTLSLDFRLCDATQRIQNLFTSTIDVWSAVKLFCCTLVHGLSLEGKTGLIQTKASKRECGDSGSGARRDSGEEGSDLPPLHGSFPPVPPRFLSF